MVTGSVTLIFPRSNFALSRTASARTHATVLAEWSIEVVCHWRRDQLELREDSAGFSVSTMAGT
jgi:hypothetical protein